MGQGVENLWRKQSQSVLKLEDFELEFNVDFRGQTLGKLNQ